MWVILGGWAPPFPYRLDDTPTRDIDAKVAFQKPDPRKDRRGRRKGRQARSGSSTARCRAAGAIARGAENAVAADRRRGEPGELAAGLWDEFCRRRRRSVERPSHDEQEQRFPTISRSAFDTKDEARARSKKRSIGPFADSSRRDFWTSSTGARRRKSDGNLSPSPATASFRHRAGVATCCSARRSLICTSALESRTRVAGNRRARLHWLKPKLLKLTPHAEKGCRGHGAATRRKAARGRSQMSSQFAYRAAAIAGQGRPAARSRNHSTCCGWNTKPARATDAASESCCRLAGGAGDVRRAVWAVRHLHLATAAVRYSTARAGSPRC